MITKLLFNVFSLLLLVSSLSVISSKNSIQSVIGLIASFVFSSILLLILGCDFFAFLFLIIYVGAIAVLFLFVIMMLDLKYLDKQTNLYHVLLGFSIPFAFFLMTSPFIIGSFSLIPYTDVCPEHEDVFINNVLYYSYIEDNVTDIEVLGQLLYTKYVLQFLIIGLILTLAVLCVGVLTISRKNFISEVNELVVSRSFDDPNKKFSKNNDKTFF